MIGNNAEFDRFVSALAWALEEVSSEPNVQQLRTFTWAGHRVKVLSVRKEHDGLVTLHKICCSLQSVEPEVPFEVRKPLSTIRFPYPVVNLHVLQRCQQRH